MNKRTTIKIHALYSIYIYILYKYIHANYKNITSHLIPPNGSFLILYNMSYHRWGTRWAKLLIWMPLQAYRFQGLEVNNVVEMGKQRGICLKRNIERHQWCILGMPFLETNTYFETKTFKNTNEIMIHLGDASMSSCHSKDYVQIIISQDLFKGSFNLQEDS